MGILKAFIALPYINWMSCRGKTAVGSNKHIITKNDRSCIKYHKIMVRIEVFSKRYIASIIAPKRRFYNKLPFRLADYTA